MNTKVTRTISVAAMCIAMLGCTKDSTPSPHLVSDGEQGTLKTTPWIFEGGAFNVYNANKCYYGALPSGKIEVTAFQSGTANLVLSGGGLILTSGSTSGSYGPYYYIRKTGGGKTLKVRVKNVSGATFDDYEKEFSYNSGTDTWSWSINAPNYFDITVESSFELCIPRD